LVDGLGGRLGARGQGCNKIGEMSLRPNIIDDQISAAFVVCTKGRTAELNTLLASLANQDFKNFEVIIVDQNTDNRLDVICKRWQLILNLRRIHTPTERGASRARNVGWRETQCPIVLFPDDDCWYPPFFLSRVLRLFESTKANIVCGRAANEAGRDINGRFESAPQWVTRKNVWTTQIEWMAAFQLTALQKVDGYDPKIGIGASTPWQACEAQDIILRALAQGLNCYYDNSLHGHHAELNIYSPDEEMCRKGRMYGRGLGHVLRLHKYGYWSLFNWLVRPMGKAALALLVGRVDRFRYYREVTVGRWEGWSGTLAPRLSTMTSRPDAGTAKLDLRVKKRLKIAVGIATAGRREVLGATMRLLSRQTRPPDLLVICASDPRDVDNLELEKFPTPALVVTAPIGLPPQRNRILRETGDADVIVFFDDDFLPHATYLANLEALFAGNSSVAGATGFLLADGIGGPGLTVEEGLEILRSDEVGNRSDPGLTDYEGTYGCNMSFRLEPIRHSNLLFDENLPLYAWQEDMDFAMQLLPHGRLVKCATLRGVHLGVKTARTPGVRLGYSQIANPIYLVRKGTLPWKLAKRLMGRNFLANLVRSARPEPWVDRKGRLKGNLLALFDLVMGRLSPSRILELDRNIPGRLAQAHLKNSPKVLFNLPSQYAGRPSGVATFAFQLLENLIGRSDFIYVLRSPWRREQLPEALRAKTFEIVTIRRPPFLLPNVLWQGFVFQRFCHRHGIDLVVNLDPYGSPSGGLARLLIVHDLYFRTIPKQVRRNVAWTNDMIFRLMLSGNSEIVTVSDSTKRDLEHWYPRARGRTTTIHSATSLNSVSTHACSEIEKPYILTVGNATANKNLSVLASALASVHLVFPDIVAVHVGKDSKETIVSTLKKLGSTVRVLRFEGISDSKLASLYRHASCLCIPSLYEGFCLPILEAQVLGCPVICSNRPALPEIAGAGALLFDPTNADALAKALLTVLQNPANSEALVRAGHENSARFSWDLAARQYEAVFRRLIGEGC
jgi:glycosyltransferase involved in cell wall biosynthesis